MRVIRILRWEVSLSFLQMMMGNVFKILHIVPERPSLCSAHKQGLVSFLSRVCTVKT